MAQNIYELKKELINFIRSADVLSITTRGVTRATETFSGNDVLVTFTLAHTPVHNIKTVTVTGSAVAYGSGFTFTESTGVITFATAPATGTNNVSITYDYGSTDRIFPDFPQGNENLSKFPRMAVDITSCSIADISNASSAQVYEYTISVYCYGAGTSTVENMISDVVSVVTTNRLLFYYLEYVKPIRFAGILNSPGKGDKILMRNVDFYGVSITT